MPDVDIFNLWRYLLGIVVTVYFVVYTARTVGSWLLWFRTSRRYTVVGHYATVLLLRARLRRFGGEVLRICLLLVVLAGVVALHWVVL